MPTRLGAIGTVANLGPGKRTVTTDSNTHFIGGAPVDTSVTGDSIALHRGRTTQVWQTTVRAESGKVCAVVCGHGFRAIDSGAAWARRTAV